MMDEYTKKFDIYKSIIKQNIDFYEFASWLDSYCDDEEDGWAEAEQIVEAIADCTAFCIFLDMIIYDLIVNRADKISLIIADIQDFFHLRDHVLQMTDICFHHCRFHRRSRELLTIDYFIGLC